jgi:hypothetical protein
MESSIRGCRNSLAFAQMLYKLGTIFPADANMHTISENQILVDREPDLYLYLIEEEVDKPKNVAGRILFQEDLWMVEYFGKENEGLVRNLMKTMRDEFGCIKCYIFEAPSFGQSPEEEMIDTIRKVAVWVYKTEKYLPTEFDGSHIPEDEILFRKFDNFLGIIDPSLPQKRPVAIIHFRSRFWEVAIFGAENSSRIQQLVSQMNSKFDFLWTFNVIKD